MKYFWLLSCLFMLLPSFLFGQSIRKDFNEMTASEKSELQAAFYQMRDVNNDGIISNDVDNPDSDDLLLDLAKFHKDFFRFPGDDDSELDIHFNLPNQINIQIFFSWHRYQMFEMEQAIQNVNPKLSLGYWDSSIDKDPVLLAMTGSLFGSDLIGPFDTDWGLNRNLGQAQGDPNLAMPTPAQVVSTQSFTEFANSVGPGDKDDGGYSNQMERWNVHVGSHVWTGGVMPTPASPSDPAFYFHHAWIDKLWVDWEDELDGIQSSFVIQSMIRYDNTYSFNGATLPLVNPNNISDTRSLGVFYGENQLAKLDNYTVNNTYKAKENFYYQYTIEVGDLDINDANFTQFYIPSTKVCEIESVNEVILKPGFFAESGADFVAKIDVDNDITTIARPDRDIAASRYNPVNFGEVLLDNKAYITTNESKEFEEAKINLEQTTIYPNPFINSISIFMHETAASDVQIRLFDSTGRLVAQRTILNSNGEVELRDLQHLESGIYMLTVETDQAFIRTSILKK